MTSGGSLNRNLVSSYASTVMLFVLDDDHVRDQAIYDSKETVEGNVEKGYYVDVIGGSTYNYDNTTCTFSVANPANTGNYTVSQMVGTLIPDTRAYTPQGTIGESDVFAEIRIVEVMQGQSIANNIANRYLHIKHSNNLQVCAGGFKEVPTDVWLYEDNSNVRSDSETTPIASFYNYLNRAELIPDTDPALLRLNGMKNFTVEALPLSSKLGKSFSFELNMNSEGVLYEAQLITSNRKEAGNAS